MRHDRKTPTEVFSVSPDLQVSLRVFPLTASLRSPRSRGERGENPFQDQPQIFPQRRGKSPAGRTYAPEQVLEGTVRAPTCFYQYVPNFI